MNTGAGTAANVAAGAGAAEEREECTAQNSSSGQKAALEALPFKHFRMPKGTRFYLCIGQFARRAPFRITPARGSPGGASIHRLSVPMLP